MAKFVRSINIEENVWNEAKTKFPNLSQFIEDFLKAALLSENNDELRLKETQIRLQQEIMAKETELVAVEAQLNNITGTRRVDTQAQNNIWRKVLIDYREAKMFVGRNIEEATKKLDVDEKTLKKIIKEVTRELGCQGALIENVRNWDFVKEHYDYVNNEGVF